MKPFITTTARPLALAALAADAPECADRACFQQHLADCQPATVNTPRNPLGQARYRILGTTTTGEAR